MFADRNFEKNPYTDDEKRVCEYLQKISNNQIGCGDDPIGFLIASHNYLRLMRQKLK